LKRLVISLTASPFVPPIACQNENLTGPVGVGVALGAQALTIKTAANTNEITSNVRFISSPP
jgi:hypothetical protein